MLCTYVHRTALGRDGILLMMLNCRLSGPYVCDYFHQPRRIHRHSHHTHSTGMYLTTRSDRSYPFDCRCPRRHFVPSHLSQIGQLHRAHCATEDSYVLSALSYCVHGAQLSLFAGSHVTVCTKEFYIVSNARFIALYVHEKKPLCPNIRFFSLKIEERFIASQKNLPHIPSSTRKPVLAALEEH
jgi:hypothetical protein